MLVEVDISFIRDKFNLEGLETKNNSEESSDSLNDPETSSGKEKGEEIYQFKFYQEAIDKI